MTSPQDQVPKDTPSSFLKWLKRAILGASLACLLMLVSVFAFKSWLIEWSNTQVASLPTIDVVIKRGDNATKVIRQLVQQGHLADSWKFKALFVLEPQLGMLKAGHYQVDEKLTPRQLLSVLTSGIEKQFAITFIEGSTFSEWIDTLRNHPQINVNEARIAQYIAGFEPTTVNEDKYRYARVEGQFFPDTYHFTANTQAVAILKRAHQVLTSKLETLWQARQNNLPLRNKAEALVLASIIEKETGIGAERSEVASVFINRLNRKMRLQTDPTVIYGMADVYDGDITFAHLRDKNAYNTYVIKRLPPTPIAMVSEEAIAAALNPATTPYFYFVASGDGGHVFSTNLKDHNRALQRYLEKLKQQ